MPLGASCHDPQKDYLAPYIRQGLDRRTHFRLPCNHFENPEMARVALLSASSTSLADVLTCLRTMAVEVLRGWQLGPCLVGLRPALSCAFEVLSSVLPDNKCLFALPVPANQGSAGLVDLRTDAWHLRRLL